MAYETWDWDSIGKACDFNPKRNSPTVRSPDAAGYVKTRTMWTRDLWVFTLNYHFLGPSAYVYLVNFFHTHRGGTLFYFPWPIVLMNYPPMGGDADAGGNQPFDSELDVGFNEGPTILGRFGMDALDCRRIPNKRNYWRTNSPIIIEQV